ncbi:hypothetical protein J2TS4_55020 [Paenibacillus sp. J2TS4]|nr:hypothetical protein J2TS4_55020 [Paenibacillus sp. J2TS4]
MRNSVLSIASIIIFCLVGPRIKNHKVWNRRDLSRSHGYFIVDYISFYDILILDISFYDIEEGKD